MDIRRVSRWGGLALMLALLAGGCEPRTDALLEPRPAAPAAAGAGEGDLASPPPGRVAGLLPGTSYMVLDGPARTAAKKSKSIGPLGGTISVPGPDGAPGGYILTVPPGAVDAATRFTVKALAGTEYRVTLTAIRTLPDGSKLDVGEAGFAVPVTLTASYAATLTPVPDPSRLTVLHLPTGGAPPEVVPTSVDAAGMVVVATLGHFSQYCIAMN